MNNILRISPYGNLLKCFFKFCARPELSIIKVQCKVIINSARNVTRFSIEGLNFTAESGRLTRVNN